MKRTALSYGEKKVMITCTNNGEKDAFGNTIWRDEDGRPYELARTVSRDRHFGFFPMPIVIKAH